MKKVITTFIALLACVCAWSVSAGMSITLIHEGRSEGLINDVPFGPSDFVLTAFGDIGDREEFPIGNGWFLNHLSAMIEIDGVGTFGILTPTTTFVGNDSQVVGFGHAGPDGLALLIGPADPAFAVWDMTTSIGPISGDDGRLLQWDRDPQIETTGGTLFFYDASEVPVTFTAEVIGAPMPLALLPVAMLFYPRRRGR